MSVLVRRLELVIVSALLTACGAAGTNPDGGDCPSDLPSQCPASVPSYQHQVAPLVATTCLSCHGPGGASATMPLGSYEELATAANSALGQVETCRMPLAPSPPLSEAQRQLLLTWLVCGAPNN